MGRRSISAGGKEYTLLAIVPRSAGYKQEWAGNFTVGGEKIHQGFQAGRDEILRFVKSYLAAHDITGSLKVWISGHSRGSAIANLLGGFFAGGGIAYFGDSVSITPEDVYCYTFATPRTILAGLSKDTELSVAGNRGGEYDLDTVQAPYTYTGGGTVDPEDPVYGGIRNYPFAYDFITYLPPGEWGFTWYGGVYSMAETADGSSIDPDDMAEELKAVSPYAYRRWINGGDYRDFREMDFDLAALAPVPLEAGASGKQAMTEFVASFIHGLSVLAPDQEIYLAGECQDMLVALAGIYGMTFNQFGAQIKENLNGLILPLVLSYFAYASESLQAEGRAESETEAVAIALAELVDHLTGTQREPEELLEITADEFVVQLLTYLGENEDSKLTGKLLELARTKLPEETQAILKLFLGGCVPGYDAEKTTLDEAILCFVKTCVMGPLPGSSLEDSDISPENVRVNILYSLIVPLTLPEMADAFSEGGSKPLPALVSAVLPLMLKGTDEAGEEIMYPTLAEAADAGLREGLEAVIEGVAAFIEDNGLYGDNGESFVSDLRKHEANLLVPNRITLLRNALSCLLFQKGDGVFDTGKNVRLAATFFGNVGKIPLAHYNEVFVAWGKAGVKCGPEPEDIQPAVSIGSWTVGSQAAVPTVTGNPGNGAVTYTYAVRGSDNYVREVPAEAGAYTVKAAVSATHDYKAGEAKADFSIFSRSGSGSGGGAAAATNPVTAYAVSASAASHGKVSSSAASAKAGDKVTVTPEPEEGYVTTGVTVTDAKGNAVPVTQNADGTWSFTMPATEVSVTPTFEKAGETVNPDSGDVSAWFKDVSENAWYHDAVQWAVDRGIMNGVSDDTFAPNDDTTRAMVVTTLWRLAGEPEASASAPFTDVKDGAWYAGAVAWAAETGAVNGTSADTFSPNEPVTREQLAAILYRYAQAEGRGFTGSWMFLLDYPDADQVSSYASEAMHWMVMHGVITGMGDGTLAPKDNATRAQIAAMFLRFAEEMEK